MSRKYKVECIKYMKNSIKSSASGLLLVACCLLPQSEIA